MLRWIGLRWTLAVIMMAVAAADLNAATITVTTTDDELTSDGDQAVTGGAADITASSAGQLPVHGCTVAGNRALLDGGGMVVTNTAGTTVVQNATLSGNVRTGLLVFGAAAVNHSTLAGNTDAGIYATSNSAVTLRGTIVAGNRNAADSSDLDCRLAVTR
jgi:hypothetical protein